MNTLELTILDEKSDYSGNMKVQVTDEAGNTYEAFMTKEEYKLRSLLISLYETLGPVATAELTEAIEDWGDDRYQEGYDNGADIDSCC